MQLELKTEKNSYCWCWKTLWRSLAVSEAQKGNFLIFFLKLVFHKLMIRILILKERKICFNLSNVFIRKFCWLPWAGFELTSPCILVRRINHYTIRDHKYVFIWILIPVWIFSFLCIMCIMCTSIMSLIFQLI